MLKQPTKKTGC